MKIEHVAPEAIDSSAEEAKNQLAKIKTAGGVDLLTIGKAFAASGYFPDARSQAQAVTKVLAGAELNIPPVASMQGFHAIPRKKKVNDQWVEELELSMSANLRAAVIQRDPNMDLRIVEHTDEVCEVEVAKKFAGEWTKTTVRYTIEDALRVQVPAGKGQTRPLADGRFWKNYPADMLFAAVMRRVAKRHAPHLFIGDRPSSPDEDLIAAEADRAELSNGEPASELDVAEGQVVDESDEGDAVDASEDPGQTGNGGTGAEAEPEETTEPDGEPGTASSGSLFDDDARDESSPEADAGDSRSRLPLVVGHLTVEAVAPEPGEPHTPATDSSELRTQARIKQAHKELARLGLTDGALDAIFKARYGFSVGDATRDQLEATIAWLAEQKEPVRT